MRRLLGAMVAIVMILLSAGCALAAVDADSLRAGPLASVSREVPNDSAVVLTSEAALDSILHYIEHGRPNAATDSIRHEGAAVRGYASAMKSSPSEVAPAVLTVVPSGGADGGPMIGGGSYT